MFRDFSVVLVDDSISNEDRDDPNHIRAVAIDQFRNEMIDADIDVAILARIVVVCIDADATINEHLLSGADEIEFNVRVYAAYTDMPAIVAGLNADDE